MANGAEVIMSADQILMTLLRAWPVVIFLLTTVFYAGASVYMIMDLRKQVKDLRLKDQEIETNIKSRLYDDKSMPIYVTAAMCTQCQSRCEKDRAAAYKQLNDSIKSLSERFDNIIEIKVKGT